MAGFSLALCACSGAIPDPRSLPAVDPLPPQAAAVLRPATGHVFEANRAQPSAPLGEVAPDPTSQGALPPLALAVGSGAGNVVHQDFASAFSGEDAEQPCRAVRCSDREAVEHVMLGRADAALIQGRLCSRDLQAGLRESPLGVELFALFVSPSSDVDSLGPEQIRRIFTGQVTDWRELGFSDSPITPIVPKDPGARARGARLLIPGDRFASPCATVSDHRALVQRLQEQPGAVALVRVPGEGPSPRLRTLPMDGVTPSIAAFEDGRYPYGAPLQLVTAGAPCGGVADLLAFARSPRGRAKVSRYLTASR